MAVQVMHVGRVRMCVFQRTMHMDMRVRLPRWIVQTVLMLVVLVMHVRMAVRKRLVDMFMLVALGEVQPNAQSHQAACEEQLNGNWLAQSNNGNRCAEEWRRRKIRTGTRGAQLSQREDEKCKAHAVSQKTDNACK